jgi:hypothetical protein
MRFFALVSVPLALGLATAVALAPGELIDEELDAIVIEGEKALQMILNSHNI